MTDDARVADPTPTPATLAILVADDEESMRHFVQRGLSRLGHRVTAVGDGQAAIAAWQQQRFDLAVVDLMMPLADGLQVLRALREHTEGAVVVLMTAHGTVATAVQAMQQGAADFVTKPFALDELHLRLQKALGERGLQQENQQLRTLVHGPDGGAGLCGQSQAMQTLLGQLERLSGSSATVLLTGESGTGKGLVAKALHLGSTRREQPFVALNCAALPDTLVESELFGHEPGAFTGARAQKAGLLHRAHRGTVFLDEIADMSLPAQAKIERFLTEKEFVPLGGSQPVQVDVRVVAATNRDLPELVRQGRFRAELMWRLDVVHLVVPPLRERREDVPILAAQALRRLSPKGRPATTIEPAALGALCAYDWPGNVRELENAVERMVVLAGDRRQLTVADLPPEVRGPSADEAVQDDGYEAARTRFDRLYFTALLMRCGGSITQAAKQAGMSRGHLHRRLRELGCSAEAARQAKAVQDLDDLDRDEAP